MIPLILLLGFFALQDSSANSGAQIRAWGVVSRSCNKVEDPDPELEWKITVCKYMADVLPTTLPKNCIQRDRLTRENGSLLSFEVNLNCGASFFCTWVCVSKKHEGPFLKVKHGPWTLCELCLGDDPVPKACYDARPRPKTVKSGSPANQIRGRTR